MAQAIASGELLLQKTEIKRRQQTMNKQETAISIVKTPVQTGRFMAVFIVNV